jgi:hypothetical protein
MDTTRRAGNGDAFRGACRMLVYRSLICGMRWECGGNYQSTQEIATRW